MQSPGNHLTLPSMYDSLKSTIGHDANFVPLTPTSFLSRTADVYPNKTSLIYEDQQYTWSQTEQRCQQLVISAVTTSTRLLSTSAVGLCFCTPLVSTCWEQPPLCYNTEWDEWFNESNRVRHHLLTGWSHHCQGWVCANWIFIYILSGSETSYFQPPIKTKKLITNKQCEMK